MNRMGRRCAAIGTVCALSAGGLGFAAQDAAKPAVKAESDAPALPKCPIMAGEIDFSVSTMTDEGPVFFCCSGCIDDYKEAPAKYAAEVKAQRETLAKRPRIQTTCPVSGKPVDGKTTAEVAGRTIGFCCADCVDKYKAEPAKFKARLEACYTYQTKCPVSGKDVSLSTSTELSTGQRIYFCCANCAEKFNKDVALYAPKLAGQGLRINLKKLKSGQ